MISVLVCTRNRSHSLQQTLKSLQEMVVPIGLPWELIIVDNNSSDNTRETAKNFIHNSDLNVKYVMEINRGLSHARNRGIEESRGKIIAFTDDDCIVNQDWLTAIAKNFSSDASLFGIGGRVELYNQTDIPVSIRRCNEQVIFSSIDKIFSLIIGCNMAFSRQAFDIVGMFDIDFGAGTRFASAEDSDFLYRIYKKGLKITYYPDVVVYHNHGRRNNSQIKSLNEGYAKGRGAFYCKYILMGDMGIFRLAYSEILFLMKVITKKIINGQSSAKQRLVFMSILSGFMCRLIKIDPSIDNKNKSLV
jgi:glycosyltransferase involved in cell wall biosynthesis